MKRESKPSAVHFGLLSPAAAIIVSLMLFFGAAAGWLAGCGAAEEVVVARLQWSIDARDWTNPQTAADPRGCSNQPQIDRHPESPYPQIDSVRVQIEDPRGQVRGSDRSYSCEDGLPGDSGENNIGITELNRQVWRVTIEALAAAEAGGAVLYSLEKEIDFATPDTHRFDLQATTSETSFFPTFSGSLACPQGVITLGWSLTHNPRDGEEELAPINGELSACSGGTTDEIVIRGVPVKPSEGANGRYLPTTYKLVVKALDDSGATLHCGQVTSRVFRPGDNSSGDNSDISLSAGECS